MVTSPSLSYSLQAIFLNILLIILPERVFGTPGTTKTSKKKKEKKLWNTHNIVFFFLENSPEKLRGRFLGEFLISLIGRFRWNSGAELVFIKKMSFSFGEKYLCKRSAVFD